MAYGKLYVCATPIGNLKDITLRALEVLSQADVILCEDTRISQNLLREHNINYKKLVALHAHNEQEVTSKVLNWLRDGLIIAQITDAGTPGISDPGARLCNKVLESGIAAIPIPGPCAYISLLSVAGIEEKSLFYGFLPPHSSKRIQVLSQWKELEHVVAIYEAPHRIIECLTDIANVLGEKRQIVMGRELTKQFETIRKLEVGSLLKFIMEDKNQQKGEFVLLICPSFPLKYNEQELKLTAKQIEVLKLLSRELPPKKAAKICHKIFENTKLETLYDYLVNNL